MICPAAPPSAATSKVSGSTWLDRLRSSRGFPPADSLGLDHFLAGQTSDSSASDHPARRLKRHAVDESRGVRFGEEKGEDLSDILCELFAMGGGGRGESSNCACRRRKSARKQQNPRFWDGTGSSKKSSNSGSSDDLKRRSNKKNKDVTLNCNNNNIGLASSGDNSLNQHRKERDSKDPGELGIDMEEPEDADLKGYSKSEVTVIDSSIQGWKVEMFVFRKRKSKSVWKVREKKSGSRSLVTARRKRKFAKSSSSDKEDDYEDDDEDSGDGEERRKKRKKKKIVRVSDSPPGSLFKNGNCKEAAVPPLINEGQVQDDKVDQTFKGVGCLRGEAPVKSFPCSSSHWKSKSGTSSVILVKPISTFDKIGIKKPSKISINKAQQS